MLVGPDGLTTPNNADTGSDLIDTFGIVSSLTLGKKVHASI